MNDTDNLQRQELIELKYIARELGYILGEGYTVSVNGRTTISQESGIIDVAMYAQRTPFALTGIGSETLTISLEVWAPRNNSRERDSILANLNALTGHRSGRIDAGGKTYDYASFLDFDKPDGLPEIDTGGWRHLLSLSGTMLVSNTVTGAVISNAVFTKLYLGDPEDAETVQGFIPALSSNTGLSYASETMPVGNNNTAEVRHNMQGCNFSLVSLVLNRPLDNAILKIIQLTQAGYGLNSVIYVKKIYPAFETTKKCRLLGGEILESAGSYLQYKLSLQEVP